MRGNGTTRPQRVYDHSHAMIMAAIDHRNKMLGRKLYFADGVDMLIAENLRLKREINKTKIRIMHLELNQKHTTNCKQFGGSY